VGTFLGTLVDNRYCSIALATDSEGTKVLGGQVVEA